MREAIKNLRAKLRTYKIVSILLIIVVVVVIVYKIAFAVQPNPGHSLTSIGDATATYIPYGDGLNILTSDSSLTWYGAGGILDVNGNIDAMGHVEAETQF